MCTYMCMHVLTTCTWTHIKTHTHVLTHTRKNDTQLWKTEGAEFRSQHICSCSLSFWRWCIVLQGFICGWDNITLYISNSNLSLLFLSVWNISDHSCRVIYFFLRFHRLLFDVCTCHYHFVMLGHHEKQLFGTLNPVLPGSCITMVSKCFLDLLFVLHLSFLDPYGPFLQFYLVR